MDLGAEGRMIAKLRAVGHEVTDFGAHTFNDGDDAIRTSLCRGRLMQFVAAAKWNEAWPIRGSWVGDIGLRQ